MMGDDFAYEKAEETYQFIEKVLPILNNSTDLFEMKYSTIHDYMQAINQELKEREDL